MPEPPKVVGMSPAARSSFDDELARARLAFISAGQPALGAPRRASSDANEDEPAIPPDADAVAVEVSAPHDSVVSRPSKLFEVTVRHVVAIAVLLVCGVGITLTVLGRSSASQVPVLAMSTESVVNTGDASAPSPTPSLLRVHVLGAVSSPGVVTVAEGAIVQDAVLAAGGLRADADPAELNLAAAVSEGQQVIVGTVEEPRGEVVQESGDEQSGLPGTPLNLNTATVSQLEDLPGVGPVTAEAIIDWRETNNGFRSVADLQEVTGIGPKSFVKLEPLVRV